MLELTSVSIAIDLATRRRDDAGKALGLVERQWSGARDQIDQLTSYAMETESKWSLSAQNQPTTELVLHYYQFMERLRQAIDLQSQVVADLERQRVVAERNLVQAEVRVAGLNKVLQKRRTLIARKQSVREQKQMDEFASMQQRRALAGIGTLELP